VLHDVSVRPDSIEAADGRYFVRIGDEVHSAPLLVGAAGTRCPVYRRFFESAEPPGGDTMLLTEVEAPESEYSGPAWASYFGFVRKDVFAWTYVVGDGYVHIGTAAFSKNRLSKKDMLFDEFLRHLKEHEYVASDFDPKNHHTSGGSIRMYGKTPMTTHGGRCHVIGDAAGLMQRDAYNGISNAILSGRLCAKAIVDGSVAPDLRGKLHPYLFQDVLRDVLGTAVPFLRRG
jgi:flavin-dependent dehydrogenase